MIPLFLLLFFSGLPSIHSLNVAVLPASISSCTNVGVRYVQASSGNPPPGFAFDGYNGTFWCSEDKTTSWIQVEFDTLYALERLTLTTPTRSSCCANRINIVYSDASNRDLLQQTCDDNTPNSIELHGKQTTSLRITFTFEPCANQICGGGIAYSEIAACGYALPAPPLSALAPLDTVPLPPPPLVQEQGASLQQGTTPNAWRSYARRPGKWRSFLRLWMT
jgi:hypothetical protein